MCMSPDQMSNEDLLSEIEWLKEASENPRYSEHDRRYYKNRIEPMEAILKERAENGTYADY